MRPKVMAYILTAMGLALAASVAVGGSPAGAATPKYEPDPQSVGTLTFYDASGNVVTSGSTTTPMATYAVGSAVVRANDVTAAVYGAQPNPNQGTNLWNVEQWTAFTHYPLTSGPSAIQTLSQSHPVATLDSGAETVGQFVSDFPNTGTSGIGCAYAPAPSGCTNTDYQNLYQIRLFTANTGGTFQTTVYDVADVLVSGNTWTQVYPTPAAGPTATTTTLSASPTGHQAAGLGVTLTATIAPTAAGSVQFMDGTTPLGSAVAETTGTATTTVSTMTAGSHNLSAVFTPTDTASFSGSTSSTVAYTIDSSVVSTATTLDVTPHSPVQTGTQSTLTATINPSNAAGTVQFTDGTSPLGAPITVHSGTATLAQTLPVGTHPLTAVFTPAASSAFAASTSTTVSYQVDPQPATTTTTALAVLPGMPQVYGQPLEMTASVAPTDAAGTFTFLDGTTAIQSGVAIGTDGTATISPTTLSAGTHHLSAQFVPTNPADFGTSTSPSSDVAIDPASTTTTVDAAPVSPQPHGAEVTFTATVSPAAADGTVQFFDGTAAIGSPVAVTGGTATATSSTLDVGDHSITATFTPADGNFTTSTSDPVTYTIQQPSAQATSVGLAVDPSGSAAAGSTEVLAATVTPSAAAGTITFFDGTTPIGSPVTVTNGGAATSTSLPQGSHSLTASFASSDKATYEDSPPSSAVSFTVTAPASQTSVTLTTSPTGTVAAGKPVTLTAAVTPVAAAGTVQFVDGSTAVGSPVTVTSGTATYTDSGFHVGSHAVKALFVPTSSADFTTSVSAAVPLTVTGITTSTALAVSPAGPVIHGAKVTLRAAVTPAAAIGTVTFVNGAATVATARLAAGAASVVTASLPAGTDHLQARFTPTSGSDYAASSSTSTALVVRPPAVITGLTAGGKKVVNGGKVAPGSVLTITAAGFTPGAKVTAVVHSTPVTLGWSTANASGSVTLTVNLPHNLEPGNHTLTLSDGTHSATMTFAIGGSGTSPESSNGGGSILASTGFDVGITMLVAMALLVVGAVNVLLGRRRRPRGAHRMC